MPILIGAIAYRSPRSDEVKEQIRAWQMTHDSQEGASLEYVRRPKCDGGTGEMRLRVRWLALVLLLAFALPGSPQDMAAREQQLRQRADEVYRLVVAGEWRKVEQYVTEDTRELWYSQPKSSIKSFEIGEIKIDPDGRRADVTIRATFEVARVPEPVTMPLKGEWVLADGEWFLKVKKPPSLLEMYQATGAVNGPMATKSPLVFDQNPIRIPKPEPGSDAVVHVPFHNVTSDIVTFRDLGANCSCLTVETDRTSVRPRGSAILTLTYHSSSPAPSDPPPVVEAILAPSMHILNLPIEISDIPGAGAGSPQAAVAPLLFDQNPIRIPYPEPGSDAVAKVAFWNLSKEAVSLKELSTNCSCLKVEVNRTEVRPNRRGILTLTYHSSTPPPSEPALAVEATLTPSLSLLNLPVVIEPQVGE